MASVGRSLKSRLKKLIFHAAGALGNDEKVWAFHGPFEGNTKYLYLWLCLNRPDLKAVWIAKSSGVLKLARSVGGEGRRYPSLGAFKVLARAKLHFMNSSRTALPFRSSRSILVCLWHGSGIKTLGVQRRPAAARKKRISSPNFFVAGSRRHAERFAAAFRLPLGHCPILGTPRLDCAFDGELAQRARLAANASGALNKDGFDRLGMYAPTWRDSGRPFLRDAIPDPERLDAALAKRNSVLYIKLHPTTNRTVADVSWLADIAAKHERIRIWPADVDFYAAIGQVDYLVTDYSSILADFVYVKDGGLILYPFDLASYRDADRGFSIPFELIGGIPALDFGELCGIVGSDDPRFRLDPAAARTRREFWDDEIGMASPRITEYFERLDGRRAGGLAPLARHAPAGAASAPG